MFWFKQLSENQILLIKFWLPALLNGLLVWVLFLLLGDTPLIRSAGLALVIVGVTLSLRRMGSAIAVIGGLSLALSPAFWSQTGGNQGELATIVIAIIFASVAVLLAVVVSRRPYIGFGIGLLVFVVLFWSQIGTPRSIRLTGFVVGWLMYLLIDMLLLTNPRPEDAPMILRAGELKTVDGTIPARSHHIYGILLLIVVGIINDPLLTILVPCIGLALSLTHTKLKWWYWGALIAITLFGIRGIWLDYLIEQRHLLILNGWQQGTTWLNLIDLTVQQFTVFGIALSILGLARLARWYPPLGTVSMVGFAAYWIFGTIYIGPQERILLLPMYVIFVLWMSYAVLAISEWFSRSFSLHPEVGRYLAIGLYGILPAMLLYQILV